ncbi:MAG: allantoinase AllB, partial [Rhodospirillales bacterium]|nr:allantoinase AllB [Rhodospirillales bacterium]
MLDLLVRNAEVVDPVDGVFRADVGILDGKIAALIEPGTEADADQEIDATGKHV